MFIINQIYYQIIIISFNYFYIFFINFKNIFILWVKGWITKIYWTNGSENNNTAPVPGVSGGKNNRIAGSWIKEKESDWENNINGWSNKVKDSASAQGIPEGKFCNWTNVYFENNQINWGNLWFIKNGWFYIFQSFFILVIFNIFLIIVFNRFVFYFNYFKNHDYFKYFIYINLYFIFYFCSILFIFNNDLLFLFIILEVYNYFIYSNIAISVPLNEKYWTKNFEKKGNWVSDLETIQGVGEKNKLKHQKTQKVIGEQEFYMEWKLEEQITKGTGLEKPIINIFYFVINSLISIIFLYDVYKFYINYNTFNLSTIQLIQNFQNLNFFNNSNNSSISLIENITPEVISSESLKLDKNKIINNKNQIICIMFKLAIAPFHFWFISLYKNISIFVTFFFNSIFKFLFYLFLFKLIQVYYIEGENIKNNLILIGSIISLLIGSIGGLKNNKFLHIILNSNIFNSGFLFIFFYFYYSENYKYFYEYLIVYILLTVQIFLLYIYYMLIPFHSSNLTEKLQKSKTKMFQYLYEKSGSYIPMSARIKKLTRVNREEKMNSLTGVVTHKKYILLMLVLSFIGIPPLSGFYIKFNLFSLIMENFNNYYYYWFGISIITILIACSFYFKIFLYLFLNSLKITQTNKQIVLPSLTILPLKTQKGLLFEHKKNTKLINWTSNPEIEWNEQNLTWKFNNWNNYYYSVSFIINLIFLLNVFYILYIPMIYPLLNILNPEFVQI